MTTNDLQSQIIDAIRRGDVAETRRLFQEHPHMIELAWRGGPSWLRVAFERIHDSMVGALIDLGAAKLDDHINDVIRHGDVDQLRQLFAEYPEMLHRGYRGGTNSWLDVAAGAGRLDMAQALLDMGADVNQGKYYAPDENALSWVIGRGDIEFAKFLLEHGADPKRDRFIIGAVNADKNQLAIVKLLDQYGVDLHEVFENKLTGKPMNALSTAIDWGREDVAAYLRSRGCVLPPPPAPATAAEVIAEAVPSLDEQVIEYFKTHFGPVQKPSLIEIIPTGISVSVHFIPPSDERRHVTLFTTGLSSHPMNVPEGMEDYARAELFIQLPPDWKYLDFRDPNHGWPHHWLRSMAQYASQHNTWLGGPATIVANDDPPRPLAPNVQFTSLLLLAERDFISAEGHTIQLYRMFPLYTEERELEIREGVPALLRAFDRHGIRFVVDLSRPNVALGDGAKK